MLFNVFETIFNKNNDKIDYKILTFSQNYFGTFTHVLNMILNTKRKNAMLKKLTIYHVFHWMGGSHANIEYKHAVVAAFSHIKRIHLLSVR